MVDTKQNIKECRLMSAMAEGDRLAFEAIYNQYAPLLMGLGMLILKDPPEVEDLLHDVFIEVWEKAGTYDPKRGTVRTWLCMRMRSRSIDRQKLHRRTRVNTLDKLKDSMPKVSQKVIESITDQEIHAALNHLPEKQQQILELAYFRGLTCKEISEHLSIPVGTVKSRLAKARVTLKMQLGSEGTCNE